MFFKTESVPVIVAEGPISLFSNKEFSKFFKKAKLNPRSVHDTAFAAFLYANDVQESL